MAIDLVENFKRYLKENDLKDIDFSIRAEYILDGKDDETGQAFN